MSFRATRPNKRRHARCPRRLRIASLTAAVVVPLALASCVKPPPAPGTRIERPGSRRPVVVVQAKPAPVSAADSAARADSIRAAAEREVAARTAAARADTARAEEVRLAAEREAVERAAAQRAAPERADSTRAANERPAEERPVAERPTTDRAAAVREARALLDSLRAATQEKSRRLDSLRAEERALAERNAAAQAAVQEVAAALAAPPPAGAAPATPRRDTRERAAAERAPERAAPERAAQRAPEPEKAAPERAEPARARPQPAAPERATPRPAAPDRAAPRRPMTDEEATRRAIAGREAAEREAAERAAAARRNPSPRPLIPRAPSAADPGVGIVDGPTYRLAGRYTFRFAGAPEDERVQWTVMRYSRSAEGSEREERVASERGDELELDLEGIAGGESRYLLAASAGPIADTAIVWAFPPDVLSAFTWRGEGHPDVRVWTTVPRTLSRSTRLVVVMHDGSRDGVAAAVAWEAWARDADRVVVAPEFDAAHWPGERAYALGNLFASDDMKRLVPESARSYAVVEEIARGVGQGLGIRDPSFDLWGHGAGASFVHRFLLFRPRAPVRIAVAANADWFTLPDTTLAFPAGVKNAALDVDRGDLVAWTRRMLVVMRGTADTLRAGLPPRAAAEAQGRTRFARAANVVEAGKKIEPRVAWWLLDVPGVGHDPMEMAPAAQMLLERMP